MANGAKENEMIAIDNLHDITEQPGRRRLDSIAALVTALTYGEMIEMADAIWTMQPDGATLTQETLPALLHRWSKARL
jgi:hypothetical protein